MKSNLGYVLIIIGLFFYLNYTLDLSRKEYFEKNKISYTLAREINYIEYNGDTYDYILSIPRLNLKVGIDNDDVVIDKSNFVFNVNIDNLSYLNTDCLINLYYNHSKYTYKIDTIYDAVSYKIKIHRDSNKKSITLINRNNEIYIGYLIDEIKY